MKRFKNFLLKSGLALNFILCIYIIAYCILNGFDLYKIIHKLPYDYFIWEVDENILGLIVYIPALSLLSCISVTLASKRDKYRVFMWFIPLLIVATFVWAMKTCSLGHDERLLLIAVVPFLAELFCLARLFKVAKIK